MRIKFLSVIVSFLFASFAITSCLDSDEKTEYSPDATIHAFGLDTVGKRHYKFTIDQLKGEIYNLDSMPMGADTIIDRILIDTLTVAGFVTSKADTEGAQDTLFNTSDSLDFSKTMAKPMVIKVWAPDGIYSKTYKIRVLVHQQDPDSLNWGAPKGQLPQPIATNFSQGKITGMQKAVILNKNILVYSKVNSEIIAYTTATVTNDGKPASGKNWNSLGTITGLPTDLSTIRLSSITQFQDQLYIVAANKIYYSANGTAWEVHPTLNKDGYEFQTLLAGYPTGLPGENLNNVTGISGIAKIEANYYFCMSNSTNTIWTKGEPVPTDFPRSAISSTVYSTNTGVQRAMLMGTAASPATTFADEEEEVKNPTVPWASDKGYDWTPLNEETSFYCPLLVQPTIFHYNNVFYAFGNDFKTFYTSPSALTWTESNKKFYFPKELTDRAGTNYSMVVDANNLIWIMVSGGAGKPDEVWRCRLNKLSFDRK